MHPKLKTRKSIAGYLRIPIASTRATAIGLLAYIPPSISGVPESSRWVGKYVGAEHSIEWVVENIRKTNCYEGWEEELRYLMYRYEEAHAHGDITNEQWERIWEQSAAHSIEHIQPQPSGAAYIHFLGNLILLTPGLNSTLSGKKPAQKTTAYRATGLYAAAEAAQTVESDGWGPAQVQQREQRLLEWVRQPG